MREWLTVIIALLILAVVLDGIRRMRLARRSNIRMPKKPKSSAEQEYGSELPNGGARVVNVRKPDDARQLYQQIRQTREEKTRRLGRPNRIPQQVALNLEEQVPTLMEVEQEAQKSAGEAAQQAAAKPQRQKAAETATDDFTDSWDERIEPRLSGTGLVDDYSGDELEMELEEEAAATAAWRNPGVDLRPAASDDEQVSSAESLQQDGDDLPEASQAAAEREDDLREPEEVLVINVMAPKGEYFRGDVLLETVLERGMRFGSMNIFHHHEHATGEGGILYSMANIVVPGTFDLSTMKEFSTPGVSLFLALPVDGDSSNALEAMVATAKAIARDLGGELKDENRSVMTAQTIEHYRSRIKEFERKQLSNRKASQHRS